MDTLFRTDAAPYEESITLIGRDVTLKISPTQFIWNTGDGESFTTTTPGVTYDRSRSKSDYVSYKYLKPVKKLSPSVNVVWGAQYSVDGGPWQTVDGTVTTTGPGAPLRVREAVPVLTSGG
ncbi:hypothetical protein BJ980_001062 [Nocardioides daedukensis]|uniref:PKD domain-containing protein n=1 Tax=Nocardioides daedukensis TaxID=634462 RepID=A0A7Y9UTG4_9ACTN|nr:hypothetical protein [Nocardioides daedukensis]NYG58139.1 hypothetical protein [Nocardioides daedukensis]